MVDENTTIIHGAHTRPAPRGTKTVYVEHSVWQEKDGTISAGVGEHGNMMRTFRPGDREFDVYRDILTQHGRWSET